MARDKETQQVMALKRMKMEKEQVACVVERAHVCASPAPSLSSAAVCVYVRACVRRTRAHSHTHTTHTYTCTRARTHTHTLTHAHIQEGFPVTALREVTILKRMKHPNIVNMVTNSQKSSIHLLYVVRIFSELTFEIFFRFFFVPGGSGCRYQTRERVPCFRVLRTRLGYALRLVR